VDAQLQQARKAAILGDRTAHQQLLAMKQRAGQRRLFGVSLSFCVRNILENHVRLEEVVGICSSTTGFVFDGEKGPHFSGILLRYINSYWRGYSESQIIDILNTLLPRITERKKGLPPGPVWIDADMPYKWDDVSYGRGEGYIGYYIDPKNNNVVHAPEDLIKSKA
jgi:hypothetical protein